jgi:hypothetical protein
MLVIQHRVNVIYTEHSAQYAEVDVQVADDGSLVIKHNPDDYPVSLESYLKWSKFDGYFVDIKQNMDVKYIKYIAEAFGDKLLGLFDIPMPSVFFTPHLNLPIYLRVSELEPYNKNFRHIWLDPLKSYSPSRYGGLLNLLPHYTDIQVIVACPSLHGKTMRECKEVWEYLKKHNIQGIVTKHVKECTKIFNE